MIIKSMSRKHASFSQLIDYLEAEAKTGTRANHRFSIFHNTYSRDTEALKAEFESNAQSLKFRKNGVYLYHEVISITRSHHTDENHQKEALQTIVREYLRMRAGKQLAYAVLHEDKKDHLHFHLVISANEAQDEKRKRLSKADFSSIQTQLEKWTLETFPELHQQAVFAPNQTQEQKAEKQKKARISNQGAEMKRRGGKTTERDHMKATLEGIFSTATSGQHFAELLEKAGLKFYTRGKNHGVTTDDGTKYRFATLGLTEAWEALNQRMTKTLHQGAKTVQDTVKQTAKTVRGQQETTTKTRQEAKTENERQLAETGEDTSQDTQAPDPIAEEMERRKAEMKQWREKQAKHQTSTSQKQKPS